MNRQQYLEEVLALYLQSPETPNQARRSDWAVAATFYHQGVPLGDIAHALRLSTLRRLRRAPDLPPLEPIASLAYLRPILLNLRRQPHDPDYVEYVRHGYRREIEARKKTAAHRRNTAVWKRR